MNSSFTDPSIRSGYIESIVEWISKNSLPHGVNEEMVRTSLSDLDDVSLIEKGESIQAYIKTSSQELQKIGRDMQSLEHTLDEEEERRSLTPLFNF